MFACGPRRWTRLSAPWLLTGALLAAHGLLFARVVWQHTALPYFDQANYVTKTFNIAEALRAPGAWARWLDPRLYLNAEPRARPPLPMLIPAALLGPAADPRAFALTWLVLSMGVLGCGVGLLARDLGDARWTPTAVALVLASPLYQKVNPNLYMMDQIFASSGLLVWALLMRDLRRLRPGSAAAAAAGATGLALVKPAAVMFLAPAYAVLALRGLASARKHWLKDGEMVARSATWAGPHVLGLATIAALMLSPYGDAVRAQLELGNRGYWARPVGLFELFLVAAMVLPPWLAGLAVPCLSRRNRSLDGWTLAATAATIVSWFLFNVFLTYTVEARILAACTPIAVCVAAAVVGSRPWTRRLAFAGAAMTFVLSSSVAGGWVPYPDLGTDLLTGPLPFPQRPIAEVGLVSFTEEVERVVTRAPGPRRVIVAIDDELVEPAALTLGLRRAHSDHWGDLEFVAVPWGSTSFNLEALLAPGWIITKEPRFTIALGGDALLPLNALARLMTDARSPLRPCLERDLTVRILQPAGAEPEGQAQETLEQQTLVLWRVARTPTPRELANALGFVEDLFANTQGGALLAQRRASLERRADIYPHAK